MYRAACLPGVGAGAAAILILACTGHADDPQAAKPPIRGLVSMGAYRFVGAGGDPVNTLEPLRAKPGIFGGLLVIASWAQLQPAPQAEIAEGNPIDKAMAELWQDYRGFPLVPDAQLRRWAELVEANRTP